MRFAAPITLIIGLLLFCVSPHAQVYCCQTIPTTSYTGVVTTRNYISEVADTTNREMMDIAAEYVPAGGSSFQIIVPNFAAALISSNFVEVGNGGVQNTYPSATVTASIEYPPGTCTQVKFGGLTTGTINGPYLVSDAVNVSVAAGGLIKVRMYIVGSQGLVYTDTQQIDTSLGDSMNIGVSGISDQTMSCDAVSNTGGGGWLSPAGVLATTSAPSVCILGDSIQVGDGAGPNAKGDQGITAPSIGPSFGYLSLARGGDTAFNYAVNNSVRQQLYRYCSNAINNYGRNDIANGITVSQLESATRSIYGQFPGIISQETLVPETTSTDSWTTLINQATTGREPGRIQFNSDVRNGIVVPNGGYFDINAAIGNSTNDELWDVTCSTACTIDGIHPSLGGNTLLVNAGAIPTSRIVR